MAQATDQVQNIEVKGRASAALSGVLDVARFEETIAVFETVQGSLTVEGESLRMVRLSLETGEVTLAGKICGFYYDDTAAPAGGFFRRFFGK